MCVVFLPISGWLGRLDQVDRRDRHPDRGWRSDGDQPQEDPDGRGQEGLQLPPPQGQPDRIRHGVHRGAQSGQAERWESLEIAIDDQFLGMAHFLS